MSQCSICSKPFNDIFYCFKCRDPTCSAKCYLTHIQAHHPDIDSGDSLKEENFFLENSPYFLTEKEFSEFQKVKFNGKYNLLGSGSFGNVFLVSHSKVKNYFAMKQIDKSQEKLELITREIAIHAKLFHKNIIRLIGVYEDEKYFYIILEYANKGNLFEMIKNKKITTESQCYKYFSQVCSAIYFLHEHNLIHRDIKPENILVSDDQIKLCDFGCCNVSLIGNRSTFCGTLEYMAPEIWKENSYNKSVDVWSLGVLLFEMTHGYSPFNFEKNGKKTKDVVLRDIICGKINYNSKILCEEGKELINKMLVYNPNKRIKIKNIFEQSYFTKFNYLEENKPKKTSAVSRKNSSSKVIVQRKETKERRSSKQLNKVATFELKSGQSISQRSIHKENIKNTPVKPAHSFKVFSDKKKSPAFSLSQSTSFREGNFQTVEHPGKKKSIFKLQKNQKYSTISQTFRR